ncbi:MAG TPA: hypothetical protein ENN29_02110 [Candidatus Hydrogenedentes bacterium]|nr:hypothetical protein [Candidatus Hydrogenedentota bacterium]
MKSNRDFLFLVSALSVIMFCANAYAVEKGHATTVPPELSVLEPYLKDQAEFENKIRAFDKLHVGIARAAYVSARKLEKEGDEAGARAASAEAQKNLALVKAAYELGLERFEQSAALHNFYGELIHDFFGRPDDAAQHWRRAVHIDSRFARAHCNFGMYTLHRGMYAMGMESMDTALRLEPNNPDFLYNMAQVYLVHAPQVMHIRKWDRGKVYREAMKMSERTARLLPNDFDVLRDHALNYFLSEDFGVKVKWRDAAKAWHEARKHARTDAEMFNTWLNEARVHIRNNDKRRSRECLDKAQAIWPDSPVVKLLLEDYRE